MTCDLEHLRQPDGGALHGHLPMTPARFWAHHRRALRLRLAKIGPVAQLSPLRLLLRQRGTGPIGDQRPLFLRKGGIDVQHERVRIRAKLGDDERHPLCHQTRYERHVTRQAAQFRHHHGGLRLAGLRQRLGQLWAPVQRVAPLARLHVHEFGDVDSAEPATEPGAPREDGVLLLDGLMPVDELKVRLDLPDLPAEGSYHTLAGLLLALLRRVPRVGDRIVFGGWLFEIIEMDGRRVARVREKLAEG